MVNTMSLLRAIASIFLCLLVVSTGWCDDASRFDILLQHGRVVDGTGAPWYHGDIGVRDGIIVAIGRLDPAQASRVIDASGLFVAPGFIDMMGQTATPMLEDPATAVNLLSQGITTINAGEGASAAPLSPDGEIRFGWQSMADYFQLLDQKGLPVNVVQTVGHTQVRRLVLGDVDRRPTDDELHQMQELVKEAMQAGAIGVSTALIYPPAVFAETEEIAALSEIAAAHGGRYYTHMRNEGDLLLAAIDEALQIGDMSGAPVHIFHLKAAGQQNWGSMPLAIARIREARSTGQQVTADIYPYINNGLGIAAFIHPRHFAEGREQLIRRLGDDDLRKEIRHEMESTSGWENWYRHVNHNWDRVIIGQATDRRYNEYAGLSVSAIAAKLNEEPWDTFFALVRTGAFALPQSMTEANKILAMQQDFVSFCTDVGPAGGSSSASHPRAFGSFPRLLSKYVRDLGVISLEQAVSQASAAAANDVLAYDRGRISIGLAADLIAFDFDKIADRASFAKPHDVAEGMRYVIVNGELVWDDGVQTDRRPGKVLRGPGFDRSMAAHLVSDGETNADFKHIDDVVSRFIERHRIPGVAVAVTDGPDVTYARGFGYGDVGSGDVVSPDSLFRIASISKPITAVAVLQLIEQDKLKLDAKVFDLLSDKATGEPFPFADPHCKEITIRHLLQHRGGWDRGKSFDAMFQSVRFAEETGVAAPAGPAEIMKAMSQVKLDFAPGERYAYSNYGYCLLGRVIEHISGQSYSDYVKQHVLSRSGITGMSIGRSRLAERQPREVRYYDPGISKSVFAIDQGQRVPSMYGAWNLEAMDSHGAWIASVTDLAKFAIACAPDSSAGLLQPATWKLVTERPPGLAGHNEDGSPKSNYYGLGWSIDVAGNGNLTLSHSGSLPGTSTRLIRRPDGTCVVVLCNARNSRLSGRVVSELLDELLPVIEQGLD
jgi:N-acyl-D-aspartate/D-glutamate deacylase/CubicO group peptidase (beta-lactamase class C family)